MSQDAGRESWLEDERVIDRFEAAWQEHGPATIRDFLPPDTDHRRDPPARKLVSIDPEYRWDRGQAPHVEDYVRDFPELAQPVVPLELIAAEVRVRRFHGCPPAGSELDTPLSRPVRRTRKPVCRIRPG